MGEITAFWFFAILTIGCALLSLFHRNVVHSAFALMGTLVGVAGLFLCFGADVLAMTQILVYAGGILVLILFGLMLTKPEPNERKLGKIWGNFALLAVIAMLFREKWTGTWNQIASEDLATPVATAREIGLELLRRDSWLLAFEFASVILLAALIGSVYIARRRFNRGEM